MRVLLVGSSGRVHATALPLIEEGHEVYAAPDTAGALRSGAYIRHPDLEDAVGIQQVCGDDQIDLAVLLDIKTSAAGFVCRARNKGVQVFGPSMAGASLEFSKVEGRVVAAQAGIPLNRRLWAGSVWELKEGIGLDRSALPAAVKLDGWAGGIGVQICRSPQEIHATLAVWLERGLATNESEVLLEEAVLDGIEFGVAALFDGQRLVPLWTLFEHKRQFNGDMGAMTGGMGMIVLPGVAPRPLEELLLSVAPELRQRGYRGVISAGAFLLPDGSLRFIEWTCRPGDPTWGIGLRLLREPLGDLLWRTATGNLEDRPLKMRAGASVGLILAGGGYPYHNAVTQGLPVLGPPSADLLQKAASTRTFLMGIEVSPCGLMTRGGRHLLCVGTALTVADADALAQREIRCWDIQDSFFRTDIGHGWPLKKDRLEQGGVLTRGMAQT